MTAREWRSYVPCPVCGAQVSTEQPIDEWIRAHPDLDSQREGVVIADGDKIVHRYHVRTKGRSDRGVQYIMQLELKTFCAKETPSQQDTLSIWNQINRTVAWKFQRQQGRFTKGHPQNVRLITVYSPLNGRVQVLNYGKHTLRLSAATPEDSDWMTWDGKEIDTETLVQVLRFDRSPDSLRLNDHRRHKRVVESPGLFDAPRDT